MTLWLSVLLALPVMIYIVSLPFPRVGRDPIAVIGSVALLGALVFRNLLTMVNMETKWRPDMIALTAEGIRCKYRDGREKVVPWADILKVQFIPRTRYREAQAILYAIDGVMMKDPIIVEWAAEAVREYFDRHVQR
jgi:hypothetical protein